VASRQGDCGIYYIFHVPTGRVYVGQSIYIRHRWLEHRSELEKGVHHCKFLQNVWNKYGPSGFTWSILERCSPSKLDDREAYWMAKHLPELLMNCRPAGSARGFKHDPEAIAKMKVSAKRVGADPKLRALRSKLARERAATTSSFMTGRRMSDDAKRKMSEAAKQIGADPEERKCRSERAKAQHAAGNLGWNTMSEAGKDKVRKAGSKALKDSGYKGWVKSVGDSAEMSRRSYCRKMFQKGASDERPGYVGSEEGG
jgi:group I intron endonuclease